MESVQKLAEVVLISIQNDPLLAVLTVLVVFLTVYAFILSKRISRLMQGADGKSLEGTIHALDGRTTALESYARKNQKTVSDIHTRVMRAVQSIAIERFDPFQNAGGQQSFSTALLNEHGDGVVISGIHSRDGVRVYAKPIQQFASERELSEEEAKAVARAKEDLKK